CARLTTVVATDYW
nr:immunoglobulin heavy chain junction region [Mus musculus]NSM07451.1 immunoglobulin heavy chain junction region [Mus musculus]NSM09591.1 immunoglobulin heavy chain junction region [Mus musculus]